MSEVESRSSAPGAFALSSSQVVPADPPVAVVGGALSVGSPSYDAVTAEHEPLSPGGDSCRSCGFVYTDGRVCPAVILAAAGYPVLADRIRIPPAADREYSALCELTVAVQRMSARLDVIGASVAAHSPNCWPPDGKRRLLRRWSRLAKGPDMKPLAVGYLRLHTADEPAHEAELTAQIRAYAEQEGLTLSDVYTDLIDPPADRPDRAGFCALMDALRRDGCDAVIIPRPEHLSRRFSGYIARRAIIEVEGGARVLVVDR